jgi:hypothetical protein
MNRRNFLNIGFSISLTALIPNQLRAISSKKNPEMDLIKPSRLKIGDKVGLVAPAGSIPEQILEQSVERCKQKMIM